MTRFYIAVGILCALAGQSAHAEDSDTVAENIGTVLAASNVCNLPLQQPAIQDYISKHVSDADMGFASSLNMMEMGQESQARDMTPAEQALWCLQEKRVAQHYGFIEQQ